MQRRIFIALVVLALLAGYPYASLLILRLVGTNTVVFTEHDGTRRTLISGPSAPRPAWIPELPGAIVLQAAHWLPTPDRTVAGGVDLITHGNVADIRQFYLDTLAAAGFDIRDVGTGAADARTAAFFGIDKQLLGYRADTDVTISISIDAPSGLVLRPRIVKLHWQQWGAQGTAYREKLFAEHPR